MVDIALVNYIRIMYEVVSKSNSKKVKVKVK